MGGAIVEADVRGDLAALCRGEAAERTGERAITLFKSVGTALADLAAATAVWRAMDEAT
jgi:ornithine cyclodeaminase